eukprot:scaffold1513_cov164-Pinguiococcus_pyrenoidosus.AAC.8
MALLPNSPFPLLLDKVAEAIKIELEQQWHLVVCLSVLDNLDTECEFWAALHLQGVVDLAEVTR